MKCSDCRWWDARPGETGLCRRGRPWSGEGFQWPTTQQDDWCGEYKATDQAEREAVEAEARRLLEVASAKVKARKEQRKRREQAGGKG